MESATSAGSSVEIKALLDVVFSGIRTVEDAISKSYFSIVGDAIKLLDEIPGVVDNLGDIQAELVAISMNTVLQANLVAYVESKFPKLGNLDTAVVLTAAIKMVSDLVLTIQDGIALKKIVSP